ncbi:TRAP transporter substrate-binding protein [Pararhodobacter oceanensis]|uniref:C4-dicarboxylate ABC transporter substrate-binding protein n=1 Tax=Pararhodobacter oceanensis TaxID=2172121 RepID=A0A2T8HZC3_9RHOB|nr:TRAP transporter substrate-binding protein DctP [Pararhodobacter oceanensis]PVH30749.1 hypothetical protein DDE20_04350 [Pararhodobacter oceanensis]
MKRRSLLAGALAAYSLPLSSRVFAQETITWRAMAQHANGEGYRKWLWLQEELPARTNGRINLEITTAAELGLTGFEMLRTLKSGLVDMAEVNIGFVSADFPLIEATELPGIATSYENGRELMDAWMRDVIKPARDEMSGEVIGNFSWNSALMLTSFEMNSLEDLRGKKIRVYSPGLAKYIESFGAEPISMSLPEVYSALQRGVIDGLLTGSDQITAMSLWEVTPYLYDVNLAPFGAYLVVSDRAWQRLPEDLVPVIEQIGVDMSDVGWQLGLDNNEVGFNAARENGISIQWPAPESWAAEFTRASREQVIPWWSDRVGPDAVAKFNETLAPITGFEIQ